mgnify:FL=1
MQSEAFRQCLDELDIVRARRAWVMTFPAYPPLGSDAEVLRVLHFARTKTDAVALRKRAYSHQWLIERGLPSGLPDRLKSSAERIYPVAVGCVGIATKTRSALATEIRSVMENAVHETYADGHAGQPEIVRSRMLEMRQRILRG